MELLKTLYSIYSPSAGEKKIKRFIKRWIYNNIPGAEVKTDTKGNIYITKGKAENYPCIVAHLDQVQKTHSRDFVCVESEDVIFGYSPKNRRQEGLGADDKNGIWIALKCLQKYNTLKTAFFVEEEIGCRGSAQADIEFFTDCRFIIQCDRRGSKDLITSISFTELCSDEFIKATGHETFGYTPADGLMTDVLELKERGAEVSCINLSCGYYQPHTDEEFTDKHDLLNCQKFVEHIIENCTAVYPHKLKNYYSSRSRHWDELEELYMITEDILSSCPDVTAEEIKEYYGCYFSGLRLEDYQNILEEVRELNESINDKKTTGLIMEKNRDQEIAMYIWSILRTRMTIIMSWGIDPGQARVIDSGMEIHVQGFLHTGFVQITLNEGTDLFEITLLLEERDTVKFIEDVFLDCLVYTLDENIEKCDNYEQRVNEYLRETQTS